VVRTFQTTPAGNFTAAERYVFTDIPILTQVELVSFKIGCVPERSESVEGQIEGRHLVMVSTRILNLH
jgi:hypothetical protein